jgi:integrase
MSVKVRPYRRGGWEYDVRVRFPDGTEERVRRRAHTRSIAQRWGEDVERDLIRHGPRTNSKEVPKLKDFAPQFLEHLRVERRKPSTLCDYESRLRVHVVPVLGGKRLDEITEQDVARLKARLVRRSPKTANNVLAVLSSLFRVAVEEGLLTDVPCKVKQLRAGGRRSQGRPDFYDFEAYLRLVEAAAATDWQTHLIVLLGGQAGLRAGEIRGLEWPNVDLRRRQLEVRRSEWRGHLTTPKSGRTRLVPLTGALGEALGRYRHLRSSSVVCEDDGQPLTKRVLERKVERAALLAGLPAKGVHILRHSFCSHLAMRGVPARTIQELAGHADLTETERYMHLSPAAIEDGIRALERGALGDILETGDGQP